MPNAKDPPAKKSRAYRETARINSRLAVEAHKRGDTKERDFQLSMRRFNNSEADAYAAEFGRSLNKARKGTRHGR